jgi:type II secretory pathway component PulF
METVPGLLPRPADVLAGVGARVGNLGAALRDAQASIASRNAYRRSTAPRIAYLCAVLMAMQTISAFVLYFIAPKFEAIFRDFGQPLPDLTAAVIQAGWWIAPLLPLLFLAELAVLAYIGLSQAGLLAWEPPGWNRLYRRRDTATILRSLALAIEVDRPVTEVFELLSRSYPVRWIRGRLAHVAVRVEEGAAWTEAMMGQGLLSRNDAAVLDAASRAGNLPWALRTVADSNERRLGYRLAAMAQWVFPVVIAGLGLLVLLFAMAYFAPLISLIRSLAA